MSFPATAGTGEDRFAEPNPYPFGTVDDLIPYAQEELGASTMGRNHLALWPVALCSVKNYVAGTENAQAGGLGTPELAT